MSKVSTKNKKLLNILIIFLILADFFIFVSLLFTMNQKLQPSLLTRTTKPATNIQKSTHPIPSPATIPTSHIIPLRHHTYQTFNNCGPAALSMALSYFDIEKSQFELGQALRPYQNSIGDNDDKSTTLEELAEKSTEFGLIPFHRPNGNATLLKHFISLDIPVIARTLTNINEDIGHYRVVRGYTTNTFIQDDSLQGKDLQYSPEEFDALWKQFNYEYLVLVPPEILDQVKIILGEEVDPQVSWAKAVKASELQLAQNPQDIYARFNLSVALFNTGDFQSSVNEYEKVANSLPFRTLWYQTEPIEAYYELGQYDKVFEITDRILNNHNRAFSELYILRGDIYAKQGDQTKAREEYDKAKLYNTNISTPNATPQ
jgi:tetratricopeptide (TPR) repeat protein